MFAIVHTAKFKLLCVVTVIKAKANIDFVHDVGLNLTNFSESLLFFFRFSISLDLKIVGERLFCEQGNL